MRKYLFAAISVICLSVVCMAQEAPVFEINDFSGGIQNNIDSTLIPDNTVQDARNVYFDENSIVEKRKGMKITNEIAIGDSGNILKMYEYNLSDGNKYLIVHSSTNLYYRQSGAEFISFDSDVSDIQPCNFAVFIDTLNYCDGTTTTDLSAWTSDNVFQQTTLYQPKYLIVWKNRLWQAGDTDEPSVLRSCGFENPSDWNDLVNLSTSPVEWLVNTSDGQDITGLFISPNGNLGILKEKSVWELGGHDKDDFYLRLVAPDIGCVNSGSYTSREGIASWLSREGFVMYDGNSYTIISDRINNTVYDIQQLSISGGNYTINTQSDWELYTSTKIIDTTISPGSIELDLIEDSLVKDYANPVNVIHDTTTANYLIAEGGVSPDYIVYYSSNNAFGNIESIDTSDEIFTRKSTSKKHFKSDGDQLYVAYVNQNTNATWGNAFDIKVATKSINDIVWSISTVDSTRRYKDNEGVWPRPSGKPGTTSSVYIEEDEAWASIDLDSSSNTYVFYTVNEDTYTVTFSSTAYVKIASRTIGSTDWDTTIVSSKDADTGTAALCGFRAGVMAIDSSDIINMAYTMAYDMGSGGSSDYFLRYTLYYASGTIGTSTFNETNLTIKYNGNGYINATSVAQKIFLSIDMAIDSSDNPHIIVAVDGSASPGIDHLYYDGSAWQKEQIAALSYLQDTNASIDIDDFDNIFITYGEDNASGAFYSASKMSGDSTWTINTVYNNRTKENTNTVSIGKNNYPVALYVDNTSSDLHLIKECTGYYKGEIHDTGITSGSFDSLSIEESKQDLSLYHYYRSSDTSANIVSESWVALIPNIAPAGNVYARLQYAVYLGSKAVTSNVGTVDRISFGITSTEGSQELASMTYNDRIWQGVSISSNSVLDKILLYDTNNAFTIFESNIPCVSLINYNSIPYLGSNNGYVYQLDVGDNDNGKPINAYIKTKDYDLGSIVTHKTLNLLYLTALESGNWNLSLDYYLDKSSSYNETFNIDLDLTDNLINYKIPMRRRDRFYTINFKIYNSNANEPFNFLGLYSTYKGYRLR